MATLTITRNYAANTVLTEAQLDALCDSIETFLNTTGINDDNIQTGGVGSDSIASNAITPIKIANDAVETAKIDDEAVTKAKLAVTALFNDVTSTSTTPHSATQTEDTILIDATAGAKTVNLPAASSNTGKVLLIKKVDSSVNAVTIDGNSSETIDGAATTTLNTQFESVLIVCDGSNWHISHRHIPSVWTTFTPTGSWVTNTTYTGQYRRVGDSLEVLTRITLAGAPTAAALTLTLPLSATVDETKIIYPGASNRTNIGRTVIRDTSATTTIHGIVSYDGGSTTVAIRTLDSILSGTLLGSNPVNATTPFTFANTDELWFSYSVPITGWLG